MKTVFVLQHSSEMSGTGEQERKLIGVYSTKEKAEEAVNRLRRQPGFVDLPDCFYIDEYTLDEDHWDEGFTTEKYEPQWSVWRRDDNGNVFMMKNGLTEGEALRLVREFEDKGHKQSYWAKKIL